MPDEILQDQTPAPDQVKTPEQIEAEIKAKLEADLSAKFKAEIAGLNRANSELKKAKDELESKTLTAEELAKKQRAELDAELEAVKRQSIQYKRDLIIDKALNESGIPLEFSRRVVGDDENAIKEDIKALKTFIDLEVARRVLEENKSRFGGNPPASTGSVAGVKVMNHEDFNKLPGKEQVAFMASGGTLK